MIELHELTKNYGDVRALDALSLSIGEGEIFGYIGPNGAGKTTTIRILCGLLKATSGSAEVAGVDVIRHPRRARHLVGYLPDVFGVYRGMRVWEYLDFFGAAYRLPRARRKERVEDILSLAGVEAMRDYFVDTLSHGMRQRVGLARTLMHDPAVLLLDEPTHGLDPRSRVEMRNLLSQLRARGKTLIVSSHILPELSSVCDRIGILEQGRLLASGSVEDVMRQVHARRILDVETTEDTTSALEALRDPDCPVPCEVEDVMGRVIRLSTNGEDQDLSRLLAFLVERRVPVLRFAEALMELEDIYMKVTESAQAGARRSTE